jgi:hypothetical protein
MVMSRRPADRAADASTAPRSFVPRASFDGLLRVECECGAVLRTYALPFGDDRGTFRAVCRSCSTHWTVPLRTVLADSDPARATTVRMPMDTSP